MQTIKNSLGQSHEYIKMFVKNGDTVVDATCGNGNDTVFLAKLVGEEGRVYSFDIQDRAIENTKKKLEENNLSDRVVIIKDGHQNMDRYIAGNVKAVMFNLGYLPGGEHSLATKPQTTIQAIEKSTELMAIGGIISIVIYYGGDSGFDEKEKVLEFLHSLDQKKYIVMMTSFINQANCPPILVCVERIAG